MTAGRSGPRATLALGLGMALAGCGGGPPSAEAPPSPGGDLSAAEIEALYQARTDSLRQRYTDADVHFVTGMIAHHAQAIVMSEMAPTHGASPTLRTLAARIINAQRDEIRKMQQWLRDRGQAVPEVDVSGIDGVVPGMAHEGMPGMLTRTQLEDLDAARGEEFDRRFLTYMIGHHQGAVTMVHELFATDGAAQDEAVFKIASDIQVDQRTEIARMRQMLEAMPPKHPPNHPI